MSYIHVAIKPGFCSWVYWLLKAQLYSAVKVCDATGDAQKIAVWLKKKTAKFGLNNQNPSLSTCCGH